MYFPLVILSIAFLVALAGAPWYAVNHSRPIGDLPYCWGTWVAVTSLISAAGMITLALLGLVWKPAIPLGGPEAVVLAGYNYLVGLGLWRRKRYGVVLHLAPVKGVAITSLMMLATKGQISVGMLWAAIYGVFPALEFIYFKKRWKYMSRDGKIAAAGKVIQ